MFSPQSALSIYSFQWDFINDYSTSLFSISLTSVYSATPCDLASVSSHVTKLSLSETPVATWGLAFSLAFLSYHLFFHFGPLYILLTLPGTILPSLSLTSSTLANSWPSSLSLGIISFREPSVMTPSPKSDLVLVLWAFISTPYFSAIALIILYFD